MSNTENQTNDADKVGSADLLVYSVFTEHNRYGEELRGLFLDKKEAEKLKKHFDETVNVWDNFGGGILRAVSYTHLTLPTKA